MNLDFSRILLYGLLAHLIRYALIAGLAYLLFYVVLRRKMIGRKIQQAFPRFGQMRNEVLYSLVSFLIFGIAGVLTMILHRAGWLQLYFQIEPRGWTYLWLSLAALILFHDAWFYWTHRLMHWKPLFPLVHRVHHLSHNPSPWASFSFHPIEAAIHAVVFPIAAMLMPLHPLAALLWLTYMTVMNVLGHLGFEILPGGFVRHRVLGWHNTAVHHDMHHRHVRCNYGLYFNIWDRLMGTNHPDYEAEFERVTNRTAKTSKAPAFEEPALSPAAAIAGGQAHDLPLR